MTACDVETRIKFLEGRMTGETPAPVRLLAEKACEAHPGSAVLLYGSGNSVLQDADPTEVLYDFYVIAPSYKDAYKSPLLRFLNWAIPPNVFYLETPSERGMLRAKYAVLSIDHFEKLVGGKTFHSYFWARFAQPSKIVVACEEMKDRLVAIAAVSIDRFVSASTRLVETGADVRDIWMAGLSKSYKAELRAEAPERVERLLESYGDWPTEVTLAATPPTVNPMLAWRLRRLQGGFLSVIRLLKGTMTFKGGVDYIVWKISRHSDIEVPIKDWERRWPLIGAPFLAARYYRMKNAKAPQG